MKKFWVGFSSLEPLGSKFILDLYNYFGDMMAKYIAMADWRIATLIYGEHYCARVADLVRDALKQIADLAPYVSSDDEKAVKAIMEV